MPLLESPYWTATGLLVEFCTKPVSESQLSQKSLQ